MAAAKEQRRLDFERSQNIALLSLLTKNPSPVGASSCPAHISNHHSDRRTLSFSRESHLVEALAFISGISDNSDHVVALCLEELPSRSGLRVVMAINRSTHANSSDARLLSRITNGLEAIFHLLARESRKHDPMLEEQILDAIIDLSRDRIFSRIKSRRVDVSYSKKGKDTAKKRLQRILSAAHSTFTTALVRGDEDSFICHVERFLDAVKEVETVDPWLLNKSLKRLVVTASFLHRDIKILSSDHILDQLEISPELSPNDINWFKWLTKKLARYRECSGYLFRKAKDNHLFKSVIIKEISPPADLFNRHGHVLEEQCLATCISRTRNGAGTDTFKARARVTALKELGNSGFLPALKKIFKESRIHAEIQIAAHYELHPAKIPPRIIKSSKDACYLCHLFLDAHGKFYTPRTHGRLYPAWRLPNTALFNRVQTKLNNSLQARIWQESMEYMETRMAKDAVQVNESEVGSLSFMSSLSSFGLLTETAGPSKPNHGAGVVARDPDEIVTSQSPSKDNSSPTPLAVIGEEPEDVVSLDEPAAQKLELLQDDERQLDAISPSQAPVESLDSLEPIPESDHELRAPEAASSDNAPLSTDTMRDNRVSVPDSGPESLRQDTGQGQDEVDPQAEYEPAVPEATIESECDSKSIPMHDPGLRSEVQIPESTSQPEAEPGPSQESASGKEAKDRTSSPPNSSPSSGQPDPISMEQELSPGISQISLLSPIPSDPEQELGLSEENEDPEVTLVQGQPFIVRLDGNQRFPAYRLGKSGRLTIHPDFVITHNGKSNKRDIVELSITWLPTESPSLARRDRRHGNDGEHENPLENDHGSRVDGTSAIVQQGYVSGNNSEESTTVDSVPELFVKDLPTLEELDAGSNERARLVGLDGEVVLFEVLRT